MKKLPSKSNMTRRLDDLAREIAQINSAVGGGAYRCDKCARTYPWYNPRAGISGCTWAHIEGRSAKGIRWAPKNALTLCNGPGTENCHYWFDNNKVLSVEWLKLNFREKYDWVREEIDGIPRSAATFTLKVPDMLELAEKLRAERNELRRERAFFLS